MILAEQPAAPPGSGTLLQVSSASLKKKASGGRTSAPSDAAQAADLQKRPSSGARRQALPPEPGSPAGEEQGEEQQRQTDQHGIQRVPGLCLPRGRREIAAGAVFHGVTS